MRPRYLILVGDGSGDALPSAGCLAERTGLSLSLACDGLSLLTGGRPAALLLGGRGAIVGTLFPRHGRARPLERLTDDETEAILADQGRSLLERHWGGYVAVLPCASGHRVFRDPSGALPCYFARVRGGLLFASDADLLVDAARLPCGIAWPAVARQLHSAGLPTPETALEGVQELLPGFSVHAGEESCAQSQRWSPWDHVGPRRIGSRDTEQEVLRRTIGHCVRSWASRHERILVSVSGGLDSSIVAASLAGRGAETVCLTMFGEDPSGDEREHARILASHLGLRLLERPFRIEDVDILAPVDGHLPRPSGRMQDAGYERAHLDSARAEGIDAFFTGSGGDNVLGFSQSAAAIADRWLAEGLGRAWQSLLDICRQTGCSAGEAARSAWRVRRAPPGYRWRPDPLFLDEGVARDLARRPVRHPWLETPPGALPGKAAHIAALLRVQQALEPARSRFAPVIHPLLSQPIIETCLAIPSWRWRAGGVDRAVARSAFAGDLPPSILGRRGKGGPDGFSNRLFHHYRAHIRERLLGGHMAAHGLLDIAALERVFQDARPPAGEERVRILRLVAAEAWLDLWAGRTPISAPSPAGRP